MRCCCCNRNLNDWESTLRSARTGDFLDMCRKCLDGLGIQVVESSAQADDEAPSEESFFEFDEIELREFDTRDDPLNG